MTMTKRLPLTHLSAILLVLALLAAGAWWYTNANDPVEGIPEAAPSVEDTPADEAAREAAGGVWNECASACPPDAEACILMCVQKCEGLGEGESVASAYYANSKLDPTHLDCSVVFPVRRALPADGPVDGPRAALEALLRGPTEAEKEAGYFTSLPDDVGIRSFAVVAGVARVDFDAALGKVAGACRVGSVRAQVEETLKQYSAITSVVITVNGGAAGEALQP